MAHLLIGDKECTFNEVVILFLKPPMDTVIINEWKNLAICLNIRSATEERAQVDIQHNMVTHVDVLKKFLVEWRSTNSRQATLGALLGILEVNFHWNVVTDFLREKIGRKTSKNANGWDDLDDLSKQKVLDSKVDFQGKERSLISLKPLMNEQAWKKILVKHVDHGMMHQAFQGSVLKLTNFELPKLLPYYIDRTLTLKRILKPEIFKHECEDIFVLEGMERHQLSILARPESTDVSGDQLKVVTVRFILLEVELDHETIIKTTDKPVHRIRFEDGNYIWISTAGSIRMIRGFLSDDIEEILEKDFVANNVMIRSNSRPIAISASPGMGKSILLGSLARKLEQAYPQRFFIFVEMRNLFQDLSQTEKTINLNFIRETLASLCSSNNLGKAILLEIMKNGNLQFEIFLDGFDEVSMEHLKLAKDFLKCFLESGNLRAYITSRPHMQNDLEETVGVISLGIVPFDKSQQITFLLGFWESELNTGNRERLLEFASKCLDSLTFLDDEASSGSSFAGIPLQCFMLAQTYLKDAQRCCFHPNAVTQTFAQSTSLFDLYSKFMEFKFQNVAADDLELIKNVHWMEALKYLFPENEEVLRIKESCFPDIQEESVCWENVFAVGIVEVGGKGRGPVFVHRTFAEFLLPQFVVQHLSKGDNGHNDLTSFIYENLSATYKIRRGKVLNDDDLLDIYKIIESSESWDETEGKEIALKFRDTLFLNSNSRNKNLTYEKNEIFQHLFNWRLENAANATSETLINVLVSLGWNTAAGEVEKIFITSETSWHFPAITHFLNAHLANKVNKVIHDGVTTDNIFERIHASEMSGISRGLFTRLMMNARHGYKYAFRLLLHLAHQTEKVEPRIPFENKSGELLLAAAQQDDVKAFQVVLDFVSKAFNTNLVNIKFPQKTIYIVGILYHYRYEHTPLHEALKGGHYNLTEYLLNIYGDISNKMEKLLQVCVHMSCSNFSHVIINKIKILSLLNSMDICKLSDNETIRNILPRGVHVKLFATVCNLTESTITAADVTWIIVRVVHYMTKVEEVEELVHFFLSRNLANLSSYTPGNDVCMLAYPTRMNLLKPDTLSKVYRLHPFDLGILVEHATFPKCPLDVIKILVELSGDPNLADSRKQTMLHWNLHQGAIEVVKYLVSKGANVNLKDGDGDTPLHWLFLDDSFVNPQVIHENVKLLLDKGASVDTKSNAGYTPLSLALKNKTKLQLKEETIKMLEAAS